MVRSPLNTIIKVMYSSCLACNATLLSSVCRGLGRGSEHLCRHLRKAQVCAYAVLQRVSVYRRGQVLYGMSSREGKLVLVWCVPRGFLCRAPFAAVPRELHETHAGDPHGGWTVDLPSEEVPAELPEPCLGINFARDGMARKEWLALVAVHSDSWLMSVAFYYGAKLNSEQRWAYLTTLAFFTTLANGTKWTLAVTFMSCAGDSCSPSSIRARRSLK
jgi:Alfin